MDQTGGNHLSAQAFGINTITCLPLPSLLATCSGTSRKAEMKEADRLSRSGSKEELLQDDLSGQPLVNPTAIDAMAAITSLTSIDLSRCVWGRQPWHGCDLRALAISSETNQLQLCRGLCMGLGACRVLFC